MSSDKINIDLTKDEALVFYDFLSRGELDGTWVRMQKEGTIKHISEKMILWKIEAIFEKNLEEVWGEGYSERLESARKNVKGDNEYE